MLENPYTEVSCYLVEVAKHGNKQKPSDSRGKDNPGEEYEPRENDKKVGKDKRIKMEEENV